MSRKKKDEPSLRLRVQQNVKRVLISLEGFIK